MDKERLKIQLKEKDEQIFGLLMDVKQKAGLNTTFRVAGGWVRDKLLGIDSNDIDVVLDDMTGKQFIELVQQLKQNNQIDDVEIEGFGVSMLNPQKSKHLETARFKVFGEWIDVVNLRAEDYSRESRVPSVQIGSPSEDA